MTRWLRLDRWWAWLLCAVPVAYCFLLASQQNSTAKEFDDRASKLHFGEGSVPEDKTALLLWQMSQDRTLSQFNEYSDRGAVHHAIAWVCILAGMLGGMMLACLSRLICDLRECKTRIQRLEEELAGREPEKAG